MSCCFMFFPFKPMDSSKSDVQSSVAEYLEKEKLCQEICETITKSVEGPPLQGNCALPFEASSLLPEFNSDEDVEDILQQISDLLGSQLGDNSQCTDIEGVEDLSVDEILKQAEQIVRSSTPYFERKTYNNCSGVEPILEPIRRSVKQQVKRNNKLIAQENPNQNESSHQDVNVVTQTQVSGSQLEVKTEFFDRYGNSPTPTNDSDDEVFESPVESPGIETPHHTGATNLRKSCSDSECHLKVTHEVKKSSSAGTCNIKTLPADVQDLQKDEYEVCERVKELTLSDLRVSPYFSSKETISEVITPEETNANGPVIDKPNAAKETNNLESIITTNDGNTSCQINNEAITNSGGERAELECENHKETVLTKVTAPVEVSKESKKTEISKSPGRLEQKRANRKGDEKSSLSLATAKQHALRGAKLIKTPKKSTAVNVKTSSGAAVNRNAENLCPNEEHCSIITDLKNQIQSLSNKITEYEKFEARAHKNETLAAAERQRIKLLQEEVKSQEELIGGYQSENQRLSNDILSAKESWKATEVQLVEKVLELERRLSLNITNFAKEKDELGGHLKQAYDLVKKLEAELDRFKSEKEELKKENDDLTVDVMRLNCELEEYKREYENWNKNENDKLALLESNAIIQSKLSQVNTEVTRKQTEIIRLNGEIGRLRGELEKIRLGSVVNQAADSTNAISQLQAALAMERDNCNEIARERDCLNNEVRDLRKQVALLDNSDYGGANANKIEEKIVSQSQMTAELEATRYKIELEHSKKTYVDLQNKYDRDIVDLGQQIKKLQKENLSLKHLLNDQAKQQPRKQVLANSKMKEDAHLLATIRGLQGELNSREKEVHRLNKELMDAKKTNRRLQQEREKALNSSSSKMRGSQYGKETEPSRPSSECSAPSTKDYNPLAYEDNQEALLFLRNENRTMLEEIKRLEQDLISLHNKRIQDMSDLQEQHDREVSSMRREHATKHSSSTVAHLQGQLYTQQMVIHHLKQQIKEYEERFEEFSILKAERDHFERALMTANQKIARLNHLASPENVQYASLLEKLEYLERRHEIREEKLQSIVKDLIAKQKKGTCSENCRDKILNKNREICYYRAEMDKILATLAEFRWN